MISFLDLIEPHDQASLKGQGRSQQIQNSSEYWKIANVLFFSNFREQKTNAEYDNTDVFIQILS